ncbi:MAG: hypothetical protein D4R63_10005 [Methylococcaceae bacterium]|nr:MAG: hypothetical protein D4R63_10005 [Methylococcaceae bacterium]
MPQLHCTKKLQKAMGLKPADTVQQELTSSILGSWHVNLININHCDCVLFVNDATLFNFLIPDVSKEQFHQLDQLFRDFLLCVLAEEGIDDVLRAKLLKDYGNISFANTNSKKVLGSMNELAFMYAYYIEKEGGINTPMLPEIIRQMNRVIMSALTAHYPINALQDLLGLQRRM